MISWHQQPVRFTGRLKTGRIQRQKSILTGSTNSFHSVIKSYYRHYRGVASKYINRYASMFAYAWNVNKVVKEGERYEHTLSTVRKNGISLTGEELRDYRLYAPADLIYRAA